MAETEDQIVAALARLLADKGERAMFVISVSPVQVRETFQGEDAEVVQDGKVAMVRRAEGRPRRRATGAERS